VQAEAAEEDILAEVDLQMAEVELDLELVTDLQALPIQVVAEVVLDQTLEIVTQEALLVLVL
jgi:hypothetical protein